MAEKLVISGKITKELEFQFSTDGPDPHGLLTYYPEPVMRARQCFIRMSRGEMKKLHDTLAVVLNFTAEDPGNEF